MGEEHDSWLSGLGVNISPWDAGASVVSGAKDFVSSGVSAVEHVAKADADVVIGNIEGGLGGLEHVRAGVLDAVGAHDAASAVRDEANFLQNKARQNDAEAGNELKQAAQAVWGNEGSPGGGGAPNPSGGGKGQSMQPDCKPVHGKCPGPKNHVLCVSHGHVIDTDAGMIIANSVAEYTRLYIGGKGGAYDDAKRWASDAYDDARKTVTDTYDDAKKTVEEDYDDAKKTVEDKYEDAKKTVEDGYEDAKKTVKEEAEKVEKLAKEAGEILKGLAIKVKDFGVAMAKASEGCRIPLATAVASGAACAGAVATAIGTLPVDATPGAPISATVQAGAVLAAIGAGAAFIISIAAFMDCRQNRLDEAIKAKKAKEEIEKMKKDIEDLKKRRDGIQNDLDNLQNLANQARN